ncbi:MAG: hypothetical protein WC263_02785 [Candidatus Micrarchaeia archaeon]
MRNEGTPEGISHINVYVYIYIMSRLINVSDPVYEQLTRIKRAKGQSYSEAIAGMLPEPAPVAKKTDNWDSLLAEIRENDKKFKGRKVRLDHDKILYDDPYDGS